MLGTGHPLVIQEMIESPDCVITQIPTLSEYVNPDSTPCYHATLPFPFSRPIRSIPVRIPDRRE